MKVFFVLDNAFPSNNPSAKRVKCYCKGLNAYGVETEVLTISHKGNPEESEGVSFEMIGVGHANNLVSKIYVFLKNLIALKKILINKTDRKDIIYLYSDGILNMLLPFVIRKKRKLVKEMCEIPFYGDSIRSKLYRSLYFKTSFKKYDGVVVISHALREVAENNKNQSCAIVRIPIIVDVEKYNNRNNNPISSNVIFHSGSHTELKDGFLGMVKALGLLKEKYSLDIHFYCTGNEPDNAEYKKQIDKYSLSPNIHYLGYVTDDELISWQNKSALFIINKYDTVQNKYCFATKLGEYLASGKLVIATNVGESNYFLQNQRNAIIIQPGDPQLLCDSINWALNHPNEARTIANNGRALAINEFNIKKNGSKLRDFLLALK